MASRPHREMWLSRQVLDAAAGHLSVFRSLTRVVVREGTDRGGLSRHTHQQREVANFVVAAPCGWPPFG